MKPLQDEATRAWNLHTALILQSRWHALATKDDLAKLQTCFVGVGFFRTLDFYATYPGLYMPRSLHIGCDRIEQTPTYLAAEIFLP